MFIDITESNFNTTKEIWENNGIKTYDVPISAADCRVEGNDAIITLRLPHDDALYTDYASIMYWIQGDDGSEREESRAGLSVPSSCTMSVPVGDDDVRSQFTSIVSGTTKGLAELRIHCENVQALAGLIAAPKAVTYLRPMWYTGYGVDNALNPDRLTPDNTVVMEDMRDALECSSLLEDRGQILNGKKYLFTFDENVYTWDYPYNDGTEVIGVPLSPSYYEIIVKDGTEDFTGGQYSGSGPYYFKDKFIYSTGGCTYYKMKRMNYHLDNDIGYSFDKINDVINGNISPIDCTDALQQKINSFNADEMININLRRNGLYLVSGTLSFEKSNICIIGHGSQIRLWKESESIPSLNYIVLFGRSSSHDVQNIEVCDLDIFGRAAYVEGLDPNHKVFNPDQCIAFAIGDCKDVENVPKTYPINMTFYNVSMDGFAQGIHAHLPLSQKDEAISWKFINCELSRTQIGYNVFNTNDVVVSGGKIDTSLSVDKMQHCVYLNYGCSNFVVENCLLENCTGGAIHQMGGYREAKNEHNRYRNLTINNCFDGIVIVGYSLDIIVEHIRGENIGNFVYLCHCGEVVIKDYKATQLPSATIHIGNGEEAHVFRNTAHYHLFHIANCVDALIEDSVFGVEDVSFLRNQDCPKFMVVSEEKHSINSSNYEDGWVDNECAVVNIIFRNCKFFHKNDDKKDMYDYIGLQKEGWFYKFNILYDCCEFNAYRYTYKSNPLYYVIGRPGNASTYTLKNCKAYYSIELVDDSVLLLSDGYYFFNKAGAILNILGNFEVSTSFNMDPRSKSTKNETVIS